MKELKKGSKKLLNAWAFYDWANSVYTLTIASSIFPIFYSALFLSNIKTVQAFGFEFKSTALITFVTAFTFFGALYYIVCLNVNKEDNGFLKLANFMNYVLQIELGN